MLLTAELPGLDCCDVGVPAVVPAPVPLACDCPAVPASGLGVVVPLAALLCVVSVAVLGVAVCVCAFGSVVVPAPVPVACAFEALGNVAWFGSELVLLVPVVWASANVAANRTTANAKNVRVEIPLT